MQGSCQIPAPVATFIYLRSLSSDLPGWNGSLINTSTIVTTPQTQIVYDGISTGGDGISIIDDNAPGVEPLEGNYSVFLFGGGAPSVVSASISQTGLIPAGTEFLLMDAWTFNASPVVAINGQAINMVALQTFANYTLYGGDISSYMGDTVTLSFTDPAPASDAPSQFLLDNVSFSTTAVPEPSSLALVVMGGLALAVRHWRGKIL